MNKIDAAIQHLSVGGLIIVADDENRESEGDLVGVASLATTESVNFMTQYGRGLICAPLSTSQAEKLSLHEMTENNSDPFGTAFTISVDATNTSTGISAADRARTIRALADPATSSEDLYRPGHMFPLIAKDGGILERQGHTEAAIELAKLTGNEEVAYICEILKEDGTMARFPDLEIYAEQWGLPFITVEELTSYLLNRQKIDVQLPTQFGDFNLSVFQDDEHKEHLLLYKGDIYNQEKPLLTRIHSECLTGDVFGSSRCDCGEQLERSMEIIAEEGVGAIIYLRQEGRGIGLTNKLRTYQLQEQGFDTYDANVELGFAPDERHYDFAVKILKAIGVNEVRLMTNNPDKVTDLEENGIQVLERMPLQTEPLKENVHYLKTKKEKFNHKITL